MHPAKSPWYIRRVRMSADNPLVEACVRAGYHVEPLIQLDGSHDLSTMVVSFPVEAPIGAIFEKELSVVDQLEMVKAMQTWWSDNAVSATVSYSPDELVDLRVWLEKNYHKSVKSVSFLLRSDHGFVQAPYEPIDEETYHEMMSKVRPLDDVRGDTSVEDGEMDGCEGGACPIR